MPAGKQRSHGPHPPGHSAPTVVGIGASAGGIQALQAFFTAIPPDLGLAYVVVMHLAPDRESELPSILGRCTSMPVHQVADDQTRALEPNCVYVIAPDGELRITDTSVGSWPFREPRGQRAAIDVFFRSLAAAHADGYAIVLSGGGSDGAVGAKAIKEAGGVVLVQDPREAAHDAMPRATIAAGVADVVQPAADLAPRLAELVRNKRRIAQIVERAAVEAPGEEQDEAALKEILELLRKRTGHDFSKYKRNTVLRRVARRMQLHHDAAFPAYATFLREHPEEIQALFDDLLISVTTFFRDPDAWAVLQERVIGPLVEEADPDQPVRAWVPGCATGEEAYSLAILFKEEMERRKVPRDFIVFASDVDDGALATARDAVYPASISADVSDARLQRHFKSDDHHCRVISEIRERVVFANHSLLRDPPFSRLNLVSCRNLLIYLDRELQEQVQGIFRYALREDGYLFLGISESADADIFAPVDQQHRIFRIREHAVRQKPRLPDILTVPARSPARLDAAQRRTASHSAELHVKSLEELAPPSALVDDRWDIVHLSESAGRFLRPRGGPLARNLTELVRPELRDELRMALEEAFESGRHCLSQFVAVRFNGKSHRVAVLAQPRKGAAGRDHALVLFLEGGEAGARDAAVEAQPSSEQDVLREKLRQAEQRIEAMRLDHFSADEDLRAANEELQSLNEEYRSTTEELETSKEELQSINEELQTVNQELKIKLEEVSRAHSDLENLMAATDIATLFVDRKLCIVRFTPQLGTVFNVKAHDHGRPIGDITHNLDYQGLEQDARRLLEDLVPIEREIRSRDGRVFVARMRPYRTAEDRITGVVLTFVDVSRIKQTEEALRDSEARLEAELSITRRLHRMTHRVATARTMQDALDEVLATAISLHAAEFGNVQLLQGDPPRLEIVAQRGFGQPFLDAFRSVDMNTESACGRAMRMRSPACIEDVTKDAAYEPYRGIASQAGYRAVQSTPLIDTDGQIVGVLSTHFREPHDFTTRERELADHVAREAVALIRARRQQERLATLYEELRERTVELQASEQKLKAQAEELLAQDQSKEEFLSILGHELRNPLAAIQYSLTLAEESGGAAQPSAAQEEALQHALQVVRRQTRHMTRLVNDLLDITRINRGKLPLRCEVIDLRQCARDIASAIEPNVRDNGLNLRLDFPDAPLYVDADPERMVQVLDNLLRNAVHYTDRGGEIVLTLRGQGGQAAIAVRDTGIGIDAVHLDAVFDPYRQVDETRRSGGLGLGLTLVKRLVEMHGGSVSVYSGGKDAGTEFVVELPLAQAAPRPATAAQPRPSSHRVLVVDDEADIADAFAALLSGLGQETQVAYSGEKALEISRTQRPDIIFLDLAMPGMDGYELAHRLREKHPTAPPALVALSGFGKEDHRADEVSHFDARLLKPAEMHDVVGILNGLPASRRS